MSYFDVLAKQLKIKGSYMYPRFVPAQLLKLLDSGLLSLDWVQTTEFELENWQQAVQHSKKGNGFSFSVFRFN